MSPSILLLFLSIFLLLIGIAMVLTRSNNIKLLMGIELMFNAASINFVHFGSIHGSKESIGFVLFVLLIAVCETALALALIIEAYKYFKSGSVEELDSLKN